jgi:SAM-dependent methyltransferase
VTRQSAPGRWGDSDFVRVWDRQPANALKAEQLDIMAAVISENWRRGDRILDLGCGTGKTEERVLERLPVARFVCVDRSEVMLGFARGRLSGYAGQCRFAVHDLTRPGRLALPESPFRFIVLVDTVHELADPAKRRLFGFCHKHLARGGILLILDRIAIDLRHSGAAHKAVLRRLQQVTGSRIGQLSDCFADRRSRDHEHPLSMEDYLRLFRTSGLVPAVLHLHFHKVLFAASRRR